MGHWENHGYISVPVVSFSVMMIPDAQLAGVGDEPVGSICPTAVIVVTNTHSLDTAPFIPCGPVYPVCPVTP